MPCSCSAKSVVRVKKPRDPNADYSQSESDGKQKKRRVMVRKPVEKDEEYTKVYRVVTLKGFANRELDQLIMRGLAR